MHGRLKSAPHICTDGLLVSLLLQARLICIAQLPDKDKLQVCQGSKAWQPALQLPKPQVSRGTFISFGTSNNSQQPSSRAGYSPATAIMSNVMNGRMQQGMPGIPMAMMNPG